MYRLGCFFVQVQVSIRRIQYEKAWSKVEEMQTEDVVFEGPIIAVNRGGAIVLVEVCGAVLFDHDAPGSPQLPSCLRRLSALFRKHVCTSKLEVVPEVFP